MPSFRVVGDEGVTVLPGTAHVVPGTPRPPGSRPLRPLDAARGRHRRRRHTGRAHPAHRQRTALLSHHHRIRAHRDGHGGGDVARRRRGDDRHDGGLPATRVRTSDRRWRGVRGVEPGEAGEVVLRGGSVMSHYLDDPEATAQALSPDGWLRTGDLGTVDQSGYLRIVGRSKDMYIVGGFNAYPAEIENVLLRHPDIRQAAVIGIPDERLGEVGMAFVVLHPGIVGSEADIIEWSRAQMANFKVPRVVEFVDDLPLNATGKVVKDALRATWTTDATAVRRRERRRVVRTVRALADLRVVELGVWVAAPSAAALLADWGAEVIKVEAPTGDPMRNVFGSIGIGGDLPNPGFALDNRGKRSIVLDLRDPDDRAAPRRAPGHGRRLRQQPPTRRPRQTRPRARGNLAPPSPPRLLQRQRLRPAAARIAIAPPTTSARSGLARAFRARWRAGTGPRSTPAGESVTTSRAWPPWPGFWPPCSNNARPGRVASSRCRCSGPAPTYSDGTWVCRWSWARWPAPRRRDRNQSPLMNPYRTADGKWFFFTGLEAERHIGAVCRALGRPELLDDERFSQRVGHPEEPGRGHRPSRRDHRRTATVRVA